MFSPPPVVGGVERSEGEGLSTHSTSIPHSSIHPNLFELPPGPSSAGKYSPAIQLV